MSRVRRALLAVLALALCLPAGAAAAELPLRLTASGTTPTPCHDGLRTRGDAVARHAYAPARAEALTVRTDGTAGDWDLAVYDAATGHLIDASATATAREVVTVLLARGQAVEVQACHRTGDGDAVRAVLSTQALPQDAAASGEAAPVQLVSVPVGSRAAAQRLAELGLDVTHNVGGGRADVVVYTPAERERLEDAGFATRTEVADLPARDRRARLGERAAGEAAPRALPSERTTYRSYADFGTDLKAIADAHPGHVRHTTLPGQSLEGRPFEGVEIAAGAGRPDDGRPIFLLAGNTHAREWPGGEAAIEFAIDMAESYGSDARVTELLSRVRIFVFPMLNPDGFVVSRTAGAGFDAGDDRPDATTTGEAASDAGAYKRKNCRATSAAAQSTPCASRITEGVDLNRAYSAFWGGSGSSNNPATQQYRGPAPFTEPEAQAIRAFGNAHQVKVFITNHTYTDVGRWLRQPGFKVSGDEVGDTTPDETRMAALGQAMADATGYVSELGYATLGNITGPSDDWFYYSQGTYGYTPELRGDNFHTSYANAVIGEYEGEGPQAGMGLREAYLRAAEYAADPADHAIVRGTAPVGRTLRLRRTTHLRTNQDQNGDGAPDLVPETFDLMLRVPDSGRFEWHVNPSTRPLAPAPEAWTLTCEDAGAVLATRTFVSERGDDLALDLADCVPRAGTQAPGPGAGTITTPGTPTTTRRLRVALHRPPLSARRANRGRRVRLRVGLSGGTLRDVIVRLRDRRGRTVLRARARRLTGSRSLRAERLRRLRPGRHVLVLTATDAAGRAVRAQRSVLVRR